MLPVQNCYFCDFCPALCCCLTGSAVKITICVQFAVLFFSQNIPCLTGMPPSPADTSPPAHYTAPPFSNPQSCHNRHTSADTAHIPGTPASRSRPRRSIFRSAAPDCTRKSRLGIGHPKRTTIQGHSRVPALGSPLRVQKVEIGAPAHGPQSGTCNMPHACRHPPGPPSSRPAVSDTPKTHPLPPGISRDNTIPFHNNTVPAPTISHSPGSSAQRSEDSCPDPRLPPSGARS